MIDQIGSSRPKRQGTLSPPRDAAGRIGREDWGHGESRDIVEANNDSADAGEYWPALAEIDAEVRADFGSEADYNQAIDRIERVEALVSPDTYAALDNLIGRLPAEDVSVVRNVLKLPPRRGHLGGSSS